MTDVPSLPTPPEARARRRARIATTVAVVLLVLLAFSVCVNIEDPARTIACTEAGQGVSLAGSVRATDGTALGGAEVTLTGPTDASAIVTIDGGFALPDLEAGTYVLEVQAEGYPQLEREIEVPDCAAAIAIVMARDTGGSLVPLIGPYL